MSRLKDQYKNEIIDAMQKKFGYKNIMEVPKLDKIVINMGPGPHRKAVRPPLQQFLLQGSRAQRKGRARDRQLRRIRHLQQQLPTPRR